MTQEQITAEEYRTAVKVMRYGIGGCGSSSYAGSWTKEADRLDAEAARKADVDALAERMCNDSFDYDTAWSEAVEPERKRFRLYAGAVLDKLAADGRLIPEGGHTSADAWDAGFEAGFDYAGNQSTASGILRDPPQNPYDQSESTPAPVERCRCGVLEDEPSDGCEWHAARAEKATEPESWMSWKDVPEGVRFQSFTAVGGIWFRHGHLLYSAISGTGSVPTGSIDGLAPFVRIEAGDQA